MSNSLTKSCLLQLTLKRFYSITTPARYPPLNNITQKTHSLNPTNMIEVNSQLKHLVKTSQIIEARNMFDKMTHRDEVSWTTIISGYATVNNTTEALTLFKKMWVLPKISMDPFVLSLALKICGISVNASFGECLHCYVVKTDFVKSVYVGSALLDMYCKVGRIAESVMVFHEMPIRNVVSWTAIITGFVRAGYNAEGLLYFSEMWRSRVVCDSYTFAIALKACADLGSLNYGREIHCQIVKRRLDEATFVANTLSTMYNKCGKLEYGLRLFERMSIKDVVSWTLLITGYSQTGLEENAITAFIRMLETSAIPNDFTYAAVISSCANLRRIEWGRQLHAHIIRLGLVDFLSVANSIVTLYAKCGLLDYATLVFQGMIRRDIVSWSTIISGYCQAGCSGEAFEYLSWMRREGPAPNEFAFASVLRVCGETANLEQGKQLHAHVLQVGLDHSDMVKSSLITMYSKCGIIKEASKVFHDSENYDIVSCTAMINGLAEHGDRKEVFDLFERLPMYGLKPDSVTFLGVLAACSHAGQVELGFHYFNSMSKEYQIHPSKEHYGCMIDVLCRAGKLDEAERMIESMPFQKDDVVWSSLLAACRVRGDVDRARHAAEKILELCPNDAGTHITMANMYAAKGKWGEAADLRKKMRVKGIIKEPGLSSININGQSSDFVSSDSSHPQAEGIIRLLDLLTFREETSMQELHSFLIEAH